MIYKPSQITTAAYCVIKSEVVQELYSAQCIFKIPVLSCLAMITV